MSSIEYGFAPGRIGRVFQPVGEMLRASRLEALPSSTALAALGQRRTYAMQVFPMLASPEDRRSTDMMARLFEANRHIDPRTAGAFDFAFRPGR